VAYLIVRPNGEIEKIVDTVVLNNGSRASLGTVQGFTPNELAAAQIQSVADPSPAPGKVLSSVAYRMADDGVTVEAVGSFSDAPVQPAPPAPSITSFQFIELFTPTEQLAIMTAAQTDPQIALLINKAASAGTIPLASLAPGLDYLESKNLITADRRARIAAGSAP